MTGHTGSRAGQGSIGIFGHYGNRNLGDEAIIAAVIAGFSRRDPRIRLVALSMDPTDSAERYRIPAFPIRRNARSGPAEPGRNPGVVREPAVQRSIPDNGGTAPTPSRAASSSGALRWARKAYSLTRYTAGAAGRLARELAFLRRSYSRVRHLDLLLVTGSNQFLDNFGGPWGFPYTLLKWTVLARLARVPVAFASVGAGPLVHPLSKMMVRLALRFATYVSYRDESSRRLVEGDRPQSPALVCPDLAHALPTALTKGARRSPGTGSTLTVGVNVMPVYDRRYWPIKSETRYRDYVETMAELARRLIGAGHTVFLFATQPSDERVMDDVSARLKAGMELDSAVETGLVRYSRELGELIDTIHSADIVVATRFHGTLLSLVCERPVLAICYHRKTADLMHEMGQARYAVTFEEADARDLLERFEALAAGAEAVVREIAETDARYRRSLDAQFDALLRCIRADADTVVVPGG